MTHVFISYVRNNKRKVQRLCDDLTKHGVEVWLDRKDIALGTDWKQAIRRAIQEGAFFIACFSRQYEARRQERQEHRMTYMNEELLLAIDILRQRSPDQSWFIPVKLNRCEIPDFGIGAAKTLRDLQYVELFNDWDSGIKQLLDVIQPIPPELQRRIENLLSESWLFSRRAAAQDLLRSVTKYKRERDPATNRIASALIGILQDKDEDFLVRAHISIILRTIGTPEALEAVEEYKKRER